MIVVTLVLMAALALADGAVCEAVGILAFAGVVGWAQWRGYGRRPRPFTVTWRSGRWRN